MGLTKYHRANISPAKMKFTPKNIATCRKHCLILTKEKLTRQNMTHKANRTVPDTSELISGKRIIKLLSPPMILARSSLSL
jgi:hypothetical protein